MLEIIVQNQRDVREAVKLGASSLEFVSAISEGGLTPSYGAMKQVYETATVPVFTMIRPHSFSFVYDETDFDIIQEDIKQVLALGQHQIVFGALHEDGRINEEMLERVLSISPDLEMTFHRAFDEIEDQRTAYRTLAAYEQVKWILTSGGKPTCTEGKDRLRELILLSKELQGPRILPGSGLNAENIGELHPILQANQYHFGSAVRKDSSFAKGFDEKEIKKIMDSLS